MIHFMRVYAVALYVVGGNVACAPKFWVVGNLSENV